MRKKIGIIMGKIYKDINRQLLQGILEQAFSMDYDAYVFTTAQENVQFEENTEINISQGEENLFQLINFSLMDGFIFVPYTFSSHEYCDFISNFLKTNCRKPVVQIGIEDTDFLKVWYDEQSEFEQITAHLIQAHSCRKILCLTGPADMKESHCRAAGYREAMKKAGLEVCDTSIVYGDFWVYAAQKLADEIADKRREKPDAIVCANDVMAIALCDALKAHGFSIPNDIIITGYDGTFEARVHVPSITTYLTSWKQLGRNAMCQLYRAAAGVEPVCTAAETGRLRAATSCGCAHAFQENELFDHSYSVIEDNYVDNYVSTKLLAENNLKKFIRYAYELSYLFVEPKQAGHTTYSICLCEDWDKTDIVNYSRSYRTEGYSERMMLFDKDGEYSLFDTKDMLPLKHRCFDKPAVTFFNAIHFQDRCYGYTVLSMDGIADGFNAHYMRYCREMNNGLEFLCIQNELKSQMFRNYISTVRDELTGLYRMDFFATLWNSLVAEERTPDNNAFVVCISLSGIYQIMTGYGKVEQDRFLITFADLLNNCCRYDEKCMIINNSDFVIFGTEQTGQNRHQRIRTEIESQLERFNQKLSYTFRIEASYFMHTEKVETIPDSETVRAMILSELEKLKVHKSSSNSQNFSSLVMLRNEIYQHPEREWTIPICCEMLGFSYSYFQRIYLKELGTSCAQDIKQSKINYAKKLLLTTNNTLQVIAEKCCYEYSAFMRAFKKMEHMTPLEYRRGKQKK